MNSNRINLISNGRYDYSGYCNPNIIKEKKSETEVKMDIEEKKEDKDKTEKEKAEKEKAEKEKLEK